MLIALYVLEGFMLPAEVLALRPFVTTDADVVETNLVEIEYDIAGFTGLNSESVDWGMTMGVTFVIGKTAYRRAH